jgi:hypothetical protein
LKNIETLFEDGGEVSIGPRDEFTCLATAANAHGTVAALVRREGEALAALLRRLDRAVGKYYDREIVTDEISEA